MGVFDEQIAKSFARYTCELTFRDRILGGNPKRADLVEGWILKNAGIDDADERRDLLVKHLTEMGVEVSADMPWDELMEASRKIAGSMNTTGFKLNGNGIYVEARQVKAMLKEVTNILYADTKARSLGWSENAMKGARSVVAERVFVEPDEILLDRAEPDGVELIIGRVPSPKGPRSVMGYYEYAVKPVATFDVLVLGDFVKPGQWAEMWVEAQFNGFGAARSQGFGKFEVTKWDRLNGSTSHGRTRQRRSPA